MKNFTAAQLVFLISPFFASVLAYLLLSEDLKILMVIPGAIFLAAIVFRANETVLPLFVLLTLALGSSYSWDLSERSYYIRFFVLILVALRGIDLFISSRRKGAQSESVGVTPVHFAFFLTGVVGLLSAVYSVNPSLSFQRAASFLLLFFNIFVYFSIRCSSAQACAGYAISLWQSLAIILTVGYLFLIARVPGMFSAGRLRLVVQNPNQLGHYCALMAPIATWYLFEKAQGNQKKIAWGILGALLLAIVWSGSRGALVTVFLALSVQFLFCYREKILALLLFVGLITSVHLLMGNPNIKPGDDPSFVEQNLIRGKTLETGSGRTGVWKSARYLIDKRPFFGYGFGIVDYLFAKGFFPDLPLMFQGGHVHDSYLEELVNLGWVGASPIFFAMGYLIFICGLVLLNPEMATPNYKFTCALYSVMVAGALSGIFESWFTSVGSVFCFPFWLTAMIFLKMSRRFNDWQKVRR